MKKRISSGKCESRAARSGDGQLSLFALEPSEETRTELTTTVLQLATPRAPVLACENGHPMGHDLERCDQCNARVLKHCPKCKRPIFLSSTCTIIENDSKPELRPTNTLSSYCECGCAHPWTRREIWRKRLQKLRSVINWGISVMQEWLKALPRIGWRVYLLACIKDLLKAVLGLG